MADEMEVKKGRGRPKGTGGNKRIVRLSYSRETIGSI